MFDTAYNARKRDSSLSYDNLLLITKAPHERDGKADPGRKVLSKRQVVCGVEINGVD